MKRIIAVIICTICLLSTFSVVASAASTKTYSTSEHPNFLTYKGYCQIQGAYKIPSNPGYLLDNYVGKYIKQGGIEYKIDNKSIGKSYTAVATSKSDYNIYYTNLTATDSITKIFPWSPKTIFYRYWTPFT